LTLSVSLYVFVNWDFSGASSLLLAELPVTSYGLRLTYAHITSIWQAMLCATIRCGGRVYCFTHAVRYSVTIINTTFK